MTSATPDHVESLRRMHAIDLLRGLAVIGMIVVAYAGDWNHRFMILTHAQWRGFALADMIFPCFLFCVGIVMPLSIERRLRTASTAQVALGILRRGAALFGLGLLLQLLPFFDVSSVRVMGILQRIGVCYTLAGLLMLALGARAPQNCTLPLGRVIVATAFIALAYGALLLWWEAPGCGRGCFDPVHSLPAVFDRATLGVKHMWLYGTTAGIVTYEPEGIISTLGALINVFIGVIAGLMLQRAGTTPRRAIPGLVLVGLALLAGGVLLDPVIPIIKKIWTPSFAILSGGFSLLSLSALMLLTGKTPGRGSAIMVFGVNATLAFVLVSMLDVLLQFPIAGLSHANLHDTVAGLLGSLIPDLRVASVTYSLFLLTIVAMLLWPLLR